MLPLLPGRQYAFSLSAKSQFSCCQFIRHNLAISVSDHTTGPYPLTAALDHTSQPALPGLYHLDCNAGLYQSACTTEQDQLDSLMQPPHLEEGPDRLPPPNDRNSASVWSLLQVVAIFHDELQLSVVLTLE
jgi:hypothetical protein